MVKANLLVRLNNWAQNQHENFVTEAFAYLLQHLLAEDAAAGVHLLRRLTGGMLNLPVEEAHLVSISTQTEVEQIRPDIEITAPGWLVYVEVKVEAPLGDNQLGRYRATLGRAGVAHTGLVFLSRYNEKPPDGQEPDHAVRWFQVATWLDEDLREQRIEEPTSVFLAQQFLGFLWRRGMALGHVDSSLADGARSLVSLTTMLQYVLQQSAIPTKNNMRWPEWLGFEVGTQASYLGVYVEEPSLLLFRTWGAQIDRISAAALGKGRLWRQSGRLRWEHSLDLGRNEVRFYDLSTEVQLETIRIFVAESMEIAAKISISTGTLPVPSIPDDVS